MSESLDGCDVDASIVGVLSEHAQDGKLSTDRLAAARRRAHKHVVVTVVDRVEHCPAMHPQNQSIFNDRNTTELMHKKYDLKDI